jgi:exopolysaccharide transport family protein
MEAHLPQTGYASVLADPISPALDVERYLSVFRRRIRLFLGVTLGVLLLAVLAIISMKPVYTASAQLALDPRKHQVLNIDSVVSDMPTDTDAVDTEVEVLRSRRAAERVAQSLNLDQDAEFNPALKQGLSSNPVSPQRAHELVVDKLMKSVKISRTGLTYVISIAARSHDPAKAARLANAYAQDYIDAARDYKVSATTDANQWINGRLDKLRQDTVAADSAVQAYKSAHGLMSAEGNTLTEQDISNLTADLATAQAAQAEQDAKLATARQQLAHGSSGEDVGEALSSPVIQQLRGQRAEVSRHVAELEAHYGPNYPELIKARHELADFDAQIHAEILRVISGLEAQDRAARSRTASVQASMAQSRAKLANNDAASVQLNELQRNADSARALYQSFLDRYKQTAAQSGLEQSDARVLSPAKTPVRPSMPNTPLFLAAGLVGGMILGAVAVLLAELLEPGLMTTDDVEGKLNVPCLATLPLLASTLRKSEPRSQPVRFLINKPFSAFAESFRNLRTAIQHRFDKKAPRVIAVTSALPNEGKTTASVCLANAIAMAGDSVVMVDCDLRRRSLRSLLTTDCKVGLLEVLAGKARLEDALVRDSETGAHILPLSGAQLSTSDVFNSEAMDKLLVNLKSRFDYVILDTAPVLPIADTRVLAPKADGVVMVARWRKTNRNAVNAALHELNNGGARVLGVALSMADIRVIARAGSAYAEHYFHAYKSYYA